MRLNRSYLFYDLEPVSDNSGYHLSGGKSLTSGARWYKDKLIEMFGKVDFGQPQETLVPCLQVRVTSIFPKDQYGWKSGKLKAKDPPNYNKFIQDAFADYIGVDDKNAITTIATKAYWDRELPGILVEVFDQCECWIRFTEEMEKLHESRSTFP